MVNRYSNITPSQFQPLSLQEIMVTPLMQRQKHDQLLAQQEMLKQGLAKVDPLDVHLNEALKYKSDIENKLTSQAELLSREGVNPNTQGDFLALNREYQNLISPTGRLGQINAAKQIYNQNFKDYLEDAQKTKGWSRERALDNWATIHKPKYTGFDTTGNITNIDPFGAPKYIDVAERVQNYAKEAGMTTEEFARSSGALSFDASGNRFVVNSSSKGLKADNVNQLNQVVQTLNRELSDPNSEVRRSIEFDKQDPNTVLQNAISQLGIYRNNKVTNERSSSVSSVDWKKADENGGNGTEIPDSIPEKVITINDNENILRGLTNKSGNIPVGYSGGTGGASAQRRPIATKDVQLKSPEYIDLATKIINQSPLLKGLSTNNEKVVNATIDYIKNHRNTQIVNRIITPTTSKDTRGYSADEIAKYTKTKQDAMETSIRNGMKVYDENGDEIKNPKSKSIVYNGEYTFNSITPIKSTNPKTKFSPISATMIDEKGNEQKVYVAQNPDRETDPLFKAQYTAFQTLDKANKYRGLKQPLKNTFTEENLGLRDVNVTYNDDGSVVLEGKHYNGKNWEEMPKQIYGNDSDFVNYIHNLYK